MRGNGAGAPPGLQNQRYGKKRNEKARHLL